MHDVWPARAWYWPAGHAAHEDDDAEKKEPAGHGAGDAVDAGAVVRGDESGADVAVVAAAAVAAAVVAAAVVAAAVVAAAVVAAAVVAAAVVAAAVVAAAVVVATAADVTSGIAAVVPGAAAAVLMAAVVVAANDVVPGPTVVPDALLYKSTALDHPLSAATLMRRQPLAPHTPQSSNNHTSQTRIIHAQQLHHKPSVTQRKSCNYLQRPLRR